jgi:hypothetical protein
MCVAEAGPSACRHIGCADARKLTGAINPMALNARGASG